MWQSKRRLLLVVGAATAVSTSSLYQYYWGGGKKRCIDYQMAPAKFIALNLIPWNLLSKSAGALASLTIPIPLRKPIFGSYAWVFGCNLEEMKAVNLKVFPTFNDFFARELKPHVRPIDHHSGGMMISPCDGRIITFGQIKVDNDFDEYNNYQIDQVKGISYPLKHLLGREECDRLKEQLQTGARSLYFCSIYLSPGCYHRFHNPVDNWAINSISRIRGELLSVSPWFMRMVKEVSYLNERVVAGGRWKHGWLSYVPVGSTNVGSVILSSKVATGNCLKRGQEVGHFHLGSMIILVFTGPKDLNWIVDPGQEVKLGSCLWRSSASFSWSSWLLSPSK